MLIVLKTYLTSAKFAGFNLNNSTFLILDIYFRIDTTRKKNFAIEACQISNFQNLIKYRTLIILLLIYLRSSVIRFPFIEKLL